MTTDKQQADIDLFNAMRNVEYGNRFEEQEREIRRHPDTGRIVFPADQREDALIVKFTTEQAFSKVKTFQANGEPQFVPINMITITTPGSNEVLHAQVTDYYQWRFPVEWKNYQAGLTGEVQGTPIEDWSEVTPSQVRELNHQNIYTVEQVASLSDSVSGSIRAIYHLKAKAKHYLESKKESVAKAVVDAQLAAQAETHKAELERVKAEMRAEMLAMFAESKGRKPGEGNPAKA
jgi:hypothetical protein